MAVSRSTAQLSPLNPGAVARAIHAEGGVKGEFNAHSAGHGVPPNREFLLSQTGFQATPNSGEFFLHDSDWIHAQTLQLMNLNGPSRPTQSNLENFLASTTPVVPVHYLEKASLKGFMDSAPLNKEQLPYFSLGDFWESFHEWSAFGLGVPINLNSKEKIVQYYVPYISAIQLYLRDEHLVSHERSDYSDMSEYDFRDSCSDSSDFEIERHFFKSDGIISQTCTSSETCSETGSNRSLTSRLSGVPDPSIICSHELDDLLSLMEESSSSMSDQSCNDCYRRFLLFEYFERDSPSSRAPLADKIAELSRICPQLKTLRSIDLHPSSWVSIAWYPIYSIPTGLNTRDISASFLTYHALSSPIVGSMDICFRCCEEYWITPAKIPQSSPFKSEPSYSSQYSSYFMNSMKGLENLGKKTDFTNTALPAFGIASYRMKEPVWIHFSSKEEKNKLSGLFLQSGKWLYENNVTHPDFEFFNTRS